LSVANTDTDPLFLSNVCHCNCVLRGFILSKTIRRFPRAFKLIKSKSTDVETLLHKRCSANSWIVVIEDNVILPSNFWEILQNECTDPSKVYGVDSIVYRDHFDYINQKPVVNVFYDHDKKKTSNSIRVFFYNKVLKTLPEITTVLPITVSKIKQI